MPNCININSSVALTNQIVRFINTLLFINIILFSATSSFANDDSMGLGIGTSTCTDFLNETVDVRDDGELTDVALFKRLEYMQWANGFMTALNIRYYEKNNRFKKMNAIKKFRDLYEAITDSCYYIKTNGNHNEFSIATYMVFDSLEKENYQEY